MELEYRKVVRGEFAIEAPCLDEQAMLNIKPAFHFDDGGNLSRFILPQFRPDRRIGDGRFVAFNERDGGSRLPDLPFHVGDRQSLPSRFRVLFCKQSYTRFADLA